METRKLLLLLGIALDKMKSHRLPNSINPELHTDFKQESSFTIIIKSIKKLSAQKLINF
jgi:hypothetical protein